MKVSILIENTCMYSKFLNAEHGFCAWIEDKDIRVLLDCGYSDNFIINAEKMGIDLCTVDYVVISHGHTDHAGGLKYLMKYFDERAIGRKPTLLYSSDDIFLKRYEFHWDTPVGMDVDRDKLDEYFEVRVSPKPIWLTENLCYMGITERSNNFEHIHPQTSQQLRNGVWCDDCVDEDTQICYRHENGEEVSVIATCGHWGICNIMEYAKKLTGANRVNTYIGGSHLRINEVPQSQVDETCAYLKTHPIENFYICHDTDLHCKLALCNACTGAKEGGVGMELELV